MTKRKWDEWGMIDRTYKVKCPNCKEKIFVSSEDFTCDFCHINICPDCLHILHTTTESYGLDGGWSATCNNCDYEVAGA